jgi:hypothetical protein
VLRTPASSAAWVAPVTHAPLPSAFVIASLTSASFAPAWTASFRMSAFEGKGPYSSGWFS